MRQPAHWFAGFAVVVLGFPGVARAVEDEVQPAFRPIQVNADPFVAGNAFGLNPWGDVWAPSPFQWPFNNRVDAAAQPRQMVALPPTGTLPPFVPPVVFPRPRFPNFPNNNGGNANRLPGQGASSGGDDSPAGVLLNVNYANMFGTSAQQLRPPTQNIIPISPYPYLNPYGVANPFGVFPR